MNALARHLRKCPRKEGRTAAECGNSAFGDQPSRAIGILTLLLARMKVKQARLRWFGAQNYFRVRPTSGSANLTEVKDRFGNEALSRDAGLEI